MGFWISFFVSLAFMVVGELLRPKQKFDSSKPSSLGDFRFPTVDATRSIQAWWGTCRHTGPSVHWFGDLDSVAIRKKVKTGWFSSTKITQGYKYYLGVDMYYGFGPLDELIDFGFDDKSVFKTATNKEETEDYIFFEMDEPTLLGTDEPKNGVSGQVRVYKGTFTQPANDYTTKQWGEVEGSGFRPLIRVVLEHCYLGNSDTPPPPYLIGRRTPNPLGLSDGKHNIDGDANAANMCYEIMTNVIFGMKVDANQIDRDSFIACGNTLADEGLGLSMLVDTPTKGKDLLADVLRHVDGVIYADPQTGLYTMALCRADYDVDTLDVFDSSNIDIKSVEFSRVSWEDTVNTTIVNYVDRERGFTNQPAPYQDLANVFVRQGRIDSEQIDFLGISNRENALKAAARANKTRSSPLCRLSFDTNREGYTLRPSKVIKVSLPELKLPTLICRVVDVNYGTLDDPAVKVIVTEDIFTVNSLAYDVIPDSGWVPPGGVPVPLAAQRLEEAPRLGAGDDLRYVLTLASRAGNFDLAYETWSYTEGTTYAPTGGTQDFTPSALLATALPRDGDFVGDSITVSDGIDMRHVDPGPTGDRENGANLIIIGNEWLAWSTMSDNGDGTYTFAGLYRGVLDTLPEDHAVGDRVWFVSEGAGVVDADGYPKDVTIHAKMLTKNPRGILDIAEATDASLTTAARGLRPYPPGNVKINGQRADTLSVIVSGLFSISWAHRNRLSATILPQDAASETPEEGQRYNVRFRNAATNALITQKTDIDATSAGVQLAFSGQVRMEIESVLHDRISRVYQTATFTYDAAGSATSFIKPDEPVYVLDGGGA